jgi:pimeloyl-ACP methyl ester carboxylesterase
MFKRIIRFTMGFTQDRGARTGLEILQTAVYAKFASPTCYVDRPIRWNGNPKEEVKWIKRNCTEDARIDTIGYSYGGGVFHPKLVKALDRAGLKMDTVCLIDPVPRLRPFAWFGTKVKAGSCRQLLAFMQGKDYPRSSGVRLSDGMEWAKNAIRHDFGPPIGHTEIDNHEQVHAAIIEALNEGPQP